ncbi:hypothetical protein [Nannocystis bainbridge]|uniref:GAPS4 PD-(D/E)XK nuclease domain-containing protein n=1 Tax=Nannocystis bainbridge TaxID=2995303 RepID=A0ABT5E6J3_9BACT|nr:hypothetical protein [Nannocystis bainbridge]MDC0721481.1 hypothetical protein [Nannocystis bainbridge]
MAEKISAEIFSRFGWERIGPVDSHWACVTESHNRDEHPTDVVFKYDDPYNRDREVYVITDLKSYAASTIQKAKIKGALNNLCDTIKCASRGSGWKEKYVAEIAENNIAGMLFVYDHSLSYEKDLFTSLFSEVDPSDFMLPPRTKVMVLGPQSIVALYGIARDMQTLRQDGGLPSMEFCRFWYPELVSVRLQDAEPRAASIEMLTGPWIAMRSRNGESVHYTFWYRQDGGTSEEFGYLFDSFFRHQLLVDKSTSINVRVVSPMSDARSRFERAKVQYASRFYNFPRERLERVTYGSVPDVMRRFDETELGWRDG